MQIKDGEFIIDRQELLARFLASSQTRGPLDLIPRVENGQAGVQIDDTARHDPIKLKLLAACLRVLSDPAKVVRLQYSLNDSTVSRAICAASAHMPGVWVTLAGTGEQARISLRSEPELINLVTSTLAADAPIRPTWIGGEVSTAAAVLLLAVLDQVRRAWLISLLRNFEPLTLFTPEDLQERLQESKTEDFRWLLNLTDKVLPIPVVEMDVAAEPRPALLELLEAGLIVSVDDEGLQFDLSEAGLILSETNKQAASRVVISQTYFTSEGDIAHDVFSFFRGAYDLFMILNSGEISSFASLLPGDLELMLEMVFVPPPLRPPAAREKHKIPPEFEGVPCPDSEVVAAADRFAAEKEAKEQEEALPGPAFWYTARDGITQGPYTPEQFSAMLKGGNIQPGDLIWNETMPGWEKAESILK